MSAHAYSEDQLVEQPAIGLFAALGWQTVSAMDETLGPGGTLGRETGGEVVLSACTPDLYRQNCSALFEHVYESYPERDKGAYAAVLPQAV